MLLRNHAQRNASVIDFDIVETAFLSFFIHSFTYLCIYRFILLSLLFYVGNQLLMKERRKLVYQEKSHKNKLQKTPCTNARNFKPQSRLELSVQRNLSPINNSLACIPVFIVYLGARFSCEIGSVSPEKHCSYLDGCFHCEYD